MNDLLQLLMASAPKGSQLLRTPQSKARGFDSNFLNDESVDPSLRAAEANNAMQSELQGRMRGTQGGELADLKRMLTGYQAESAASPLALQQKEYDHQRQLNTAALNEGFSGGSGLSPIQEREMYKRNLEKQKLNQPVELAKMREEGENFRQGRQLDNARDVVEMQMAPAQRYNDAMASYYEMLAGGQVPSDVKKIGRAGVEFQPQPKPTSTTQFSRDLGDARFAAGSAGISDPLADLYGGGAEQQLYTQRLQARIANSGLSPDNQVDFMNLLRDPDYAALTTQQIGELENSTGGLVKDDPDWPAFQSLLIEIRGK